MFDIDDGTYATMSDDLYGDTEYSYSRSSFRRYSRDWTDDDKRAWWKSQIKHTKVPDKILDRELCDAVLENRAFINNKVVLEVAKKQTLSPFECSMLLFSLKQIAKQCETGRTTKESYYVKWFPSTFNPTATVDEVGRFAYENDLDLDCLIEEILKDRREQWV